MRNFLIAGGAIADIKMPARTVSPEIVIPEIGARTVIPEIVIPEYDYSYTEAADAVPNPFMITIEFWDQDPNKIRVEIEPGKVSLKWWETYIGLSGVRGNRYGSLNYGNRRLHEPISKKELCSLILDDLSVLEMFINMDAFPVDSVEEPYGKVIPDGPLREYVDRLNKAKQHKDIIDL